jgi:hypothetical protein
MSKESVVKLVLHMGASKQEDKNGEPVLTDDHGIVEWNSDIRKVIGFKDMDDLKDKEQALADIISQWLTLSVQDP